MFTHCVRHCFVHPKRSFKNATRDYGELNKYEKDMILHHMWPVTPIPPHTKYGWLIVKMDKKAAMHDYAIKMRYKKRKRKMRKLEKQNKKVIE